MRTTIGYIAAVVVTYVVGVIAASQHVVGRFEAMTGSSVGFSERASWAFKDVVGMLSPPIYPLAIAVMILIAFAVAGFLVRRVFDSKSGMRRLGFVLAGALGMVGLHLTLNAVFEINSIAASRDFLGLAGQALAGALGGLAYLWIHPINHSTNDPTSDQSDTQRPPAGADSNAHSARTAA